MTFLWGVLLVICGGTFGFIAAAICAAGGRTDMEIKIALLEGENARLKQALKKVEK